MTANDLSPLERLLAEAVLTGTFGYARSAPTRTMQPACARRRPQTARWTPEEQAQHVAELEAALDAIESRGPARPRHLHVVDSDAARKAA